MRYNDDNEEITAYNEAHTNFSSVGWPGDGSGMDDLADYNQNEAMDYCDE